MHWYFYLIIALALVVGGMAAFKHRAFLKAKATYEAGQLKTAADKAEAELRSRL